MLLCMAEQFKTRVRSIAAIVITVLFAGVAFFMFGHVIPRVVADCSLPPDQLIAWAPKDARDFTTACDTQAYLQLRLLDMLFPLFSAASVTGWILIAAQKLRLHRKLALALAAVPVVGMVLDYVENLVLWLLYFIHDIADPVLHVGGFASALKSPVVMLGLAIMCVLGAVVLVRHLVRR